MPGRVTSDSRIHRKTPVERKGGEGFTLSHLRF